MIELIQFHSAASKMLKSKHVLRRLAACLSGLADLGMISACGSRVEDSGIIIAFDRPPSALSSTNESQFTPTELNITPMATAGYFMQLDVTVSGPTITTVRSGLLVPLTSDGSSFWSYDIPLPWEINMEIESGSNISIVANEYYTIPYLGWSNQLNWVGTASGLTLQPGVQTLVEIFAVCQISIFLC